MWAPRPPGCHPHAPGLPPWTAGLGARAPRLGASGLTQGLLHVNRKKRGTLSTHPLRGPELRALRRLQRDYPGAPQVFVSEQGGPLSTSSVRRILTRAGALAALPFPVHPHMLRHACGFKLANDGQDTRAIQHYLGHRNIQHTVLYTELAADRFKGFWKE